MMIRILFFLFFASVSFSVTAFDGDYVLEERFNTQLLKAEQGDTKAQYAIGEMYEKGRGTERNQAKAFQWYIKSAKQENKKAAYKIGYGFLKGRGISKNSGKALKWLRISAAKGYQRAEFYIGEIYEKGVGVLPDLDISLKWYKKALKGGFDPANKRIQRVQALQKKQQHQRTTQSETVALKKLTQTRKAKPQKVSIKRPNLTTKQLLLKGGWKKRNKPVEYLPSSVAKCKDTGKTLECISKNQKRNIGMADITYRTKATLYSIKDSGSFKISYRNNVVAIKVTDPEFAESGGKVPVKLGWQAVEHSLVCKINGTKEVKCKKNKVRTIKFTR